MISSSHRLTWLLLALAVSVLSPDSVAAQEEGSAVDAPSPEELKEHSLAAHPRLMVAADRFEALRRQIEDDEQLGRWYAEVKRRADQYLESNLPRYVIADGLRLLSTSRRTLEHVRALALVYRIEEDPKYARRIWKELKRAASFPDWNPKHFLDVGEMTHAFALGYDWLYDYWSDEQLGLLERAIARYGLNPAMAAYRGTLPEQESWWTDAEHNWNQVVNGGVGVGALAVMDVYPDLAANVLHEALTRLPAAMHHYAPDGAWNEGPGYWHYATRYNTYIISALNTAYGTDFGLSGVPGFSETGWYPIYLTSPIGRSFNFADSGDDRVQGEELFWLADRYDEPAFARYQQQWADASPMNLVWFTPRLAQPGSSGGSPPLGRHFAGTEVATFRSAWNEPGAIFTGLKAGDNKANHSNLDLGTFILDALGERWATELGSDDYNMPGYFSTDSLRWTYYRMRPEGQNTLVLNPGVVPSQDPKAAAKITRFKSTPQEGFAIADLSPAYAEHARHVERGLMINRRQVLVQDEIEAERPLDVWWFMHTTADVDISDEGRTATLRKNGKRMQARLLAPAEGRFTVRPAHPLSSSPDPEMQADNEGVRKLTLHLKGEANQRIAVAFSPLEDEQSAPGDWPTVQPLADW